MRESARWAHVLIGFPSEAPGLVISRKSRSGPELTIVDATSDIAKMLGCPSNRLVRRRLSQA